MVLIGDNLIAKQKLQDLKKYFDAYSVLENIFDVQKLLKAQIQLKSITEKSDLVKKLIISTGEYELRSIALKKTIGKIVEFDKTVIANNDETEKIKFQQIVVEIAWYIRNYRFNFIDYPYLASIVLEIMIKKQGNANADISDLFSKL